MILIMRGVFHTGPEESSKGWPKGFEPGIVCSSVLRMKDCVGLRREWEARGPRDGGPGRARTADTSIFSRVLYQLSYRATVARGA